MKNLTNQQKKQILSSSNKIGTMVSFGNYEGKILSITQTVFNEIFLTLSYNTSNGLKITELSTDLVNPI
jgi:hypothetical protein